MIIECISAWEDENPIKSPAQFKRIENGLRNAAYWIKNPDQKSACWKNEIFSYPKRVKLEDARAGKAWSSRHYTVNPDYKRKCVFIENDKSRQYEVYFESKSEMDAWLKNIIIAKKYAMKRS